MRLQIIGNTKALFGMHGDIGVENVLKAIELIADTAVIDIDELNTVSESGAIYITNRGKILDTFTKNDEYLAKYKFTPTGLKQKYTGYPLFASFVKCNGIWEGAFIGTGVALFEMCKEHYPGNKTDYSEQYMEVFSGDNRYVDIKGFGLTEVLKNSLLVPKKIVSEDTVYSDSDNSDSEIVDAEKAIERCKKRIDAEIKSNSKYRGSNKHNKELKKLSRLEDRLAKLKKSKLLFDPDLIKVKDDTVLKSCYDSIDDILWLEPQDIYSVHFCWEDTETLRIKKELADAIGSEEDTRKFDDQEPVVANTINDYDEENDSSLIDTTEDIKACAVSNDIIETEDEQIDLGEVITSAIVEAVEEVVCSSSDAEEQVTEVDETVEITEYPVDTEDTTKEVVEETTESEEETIVEETVTDKTVEETIEENVENVAEEDEEDEEVSLDVINLMDHDSDLFYNANNKIKMQLKADLISNIYENLLIKEHWKLGSKDRLSFYLVGLFILISNNRKHNKTSIHGNGYTMSADFKKQLVNTGLIDKYGNFIYIVDHTPRKDNFFDKELYLLVNKMTLLELGFELKDIRQLPQPIKFVQNNSDLIFRGSIHDFDLNDTLHLNHIINERRYRFPSKYKNTPSEVLAEKVKSAISMALKIAKTDYKYIVPKYDFKRKTIQFLIPLHLDTRIDEPAELSIVVGYVNGIWNIYTVLYTDDAYDCARLISKPSIDWLKPYKNN